MTFFPSVMRLENRLEWVKVVKHAWIPIWNLSITQSSISRALLHAYMLESESSSSLSRQFEIWAWVSICSQLAKIAHNSWPEETHLIKQCVISKTENSCENSVLVICPWSVCVSDCSQFVKLSVSSQLAKIDHNYWIIRSISKNKCVHVHTGVDDI